MEALRRPSSIAAFTKSVLKRKVAGERERESERERGRMEWIESSHKCHSPTTNSGVPEPPPMTRGRLPAKRSQNQCEKFPAAYTSVPTATKATWDRLFMEGHRADVRIKTESGLTISAHSCILGVVSPVLNNILKQSKGHRRRRSFWIRGVPHQAVQVFIRFLYSSSYEKEDLNKYAVHLLALSHAFAIPALKQLCVWHLESGLLTIDNVADMYKLSRLCDVPRLTLLCHRFILKRFRLVSATEGWKAMKQSDPKLEQELLESLVEADSRKRDRMKKVEEQKIYMQLYEAMEALIHICRDGCRTIGPQDKVLGESKAPCSFPACKGLESLVRHFAGCNSRVPGGCVHCKRMWQLLELHSRICSDPDSCKVPLCRHFKEKMQQQNKKDEIKWKLLVTKVLGAGTANSISRSIVAASA